MGTNYYRVNIPTEDDKIAMHRCIDEGRIKSEKTGWSSEDENIPDALEDIINRCTEEVHICKMSFGWKTCFDHNWGKYYKPNRESLEKFLQTPNTVIKDEYGKIIPYDEFWKDVNTRDNLIRKDGRKPFTAKTYREWERENSSNHPDYFCKEDRNRCEKEFGVFCDDDDFEVDGLRFAVFSDFS